MSPRFHFFINGANQSRILGPVAASLRSRNFECSFFDPLPEGKEDPDAALSEFNFRCAAIADCAPSRGDVLITGNDKGIPEYDALIERALAMGCIYVGVVDGVRADKRYKRTQYVFGWGPSSVGRYPQDVIVTGSPSIESCWQDKIAFANPAYAVLNYKTTSKAMRPGPGSETSRHQWLDAAVSACNALGLPVRISGHPRNTPDRLNVQMTTQPFSQLIRGASLLITPVSTVVFQAIASGTPVVVMRSGSENLGELAEPMDAFDIVQHEDDLVPACRRAVARHLSFRDGAMRFFNTHVSIAPKQTAVERMAHALLNFAGTRNAQR